MPIVNDYSPDEEDKPQGGGMGHGITGGGGAPGGGSTSQATPQKEAEFVPWSRFVSANEDVSKREAGKLAGGVQGDVDRTKSALGAATDAFGNAIESNYEHGKQGASGSIKPQAPAQAFGNNAVQPAGAFTSFQPQPQQPPATRADAIQGGGMVAEAAREQSLSAAPVSNRTGLAAGAIDKPNAPKSLEESLGKDAWTKLLGDATRAESEAGALGSESGVESLLQKQGASPNSEFDAALIGGAGGKQFEDVAKAGKGLLGSIGDANQGAQGAWQRLMADVNNARRERTATAEADATNARNAAAAAAAQGGAGASAGPAPFAPQGYKSYEDFKSQLSGGAGVHKTGTGFDPMQGLTDALGKSGVYGGNSPAEWFRKTFLGGAGDSVGGSLDDQNRMNAFSQIEKEYGGEAAKWLFEHLTQGVWDGFAGQNSGAIYRLLKELLESSIKNGALPRPTIGNSNKESEVQVAGKTAGESDYGTTDEQETARTNAYREGWGEEWDRQFREGNQNPEKPNG